jgi:polyisoprenoid-binding protein YceI
MKHCYSWLCMALLLGVSSSASAQRYSTRTGSVSFFSVSIMEDIEAKTNQGAALLDMQTTQVAFAIPIRSFEFKRTLMQEHFNENYMESDRFPKATFKGRVTNLNVDQLHKGGAQRVNVEGDLTLHGVTRRVQTTGSLEIASGRLLVHTLFSVAPADYALDVPLLVREHIGKVVTIRVSMACDPISPVTLAQP